MVEEDFVKARKINDDKLYNINSTSIKSKKKFSIRKHPVMFFIGIALLSLLGVFAWFFTDKLSGMSQLKNSDNGVHLNVGNKEFVANVVNIDNIKSGGGNTFFAKDALFVILSKDKNAPRLRLPNISVNILWLDKTFKVVSFEKKDKLNSDNVLSPPDNADFALIIKDGELHDTQIQKGTEVMIPNKMELLAT